MQWREHSSPPNVNRVWVSHVAWHVVSQSPRSEGYCPGSRFSCSVSSLHENQHFYIPIRSGNSGQRAPPRDVSPQIPSYLLNCLLSYLVSAWPWEIWDYINAGRVARKSTLTRRNCNHLIHVHVTPLPSLGKFVKIQLQIILQKSLNRAWTYQLPIRLLGILKCFFSILTDRKVILILLSVAIGVMILGMIIITVAICCVFQR